MRVCVLQHVPFEGIGSMAPWLLERGAEIHYARMFDTPVFPEPGAFDLVVAMGGPMSANDEDRLPWLAPEKRFIAATIAKGIPTLGVCLGAQLIAASLGAAVRRNDYREIGWFEVDATAESAGKTGMFHFPPRFNAFHWHGETFDIPAGATRLAGNAACANQAFQYADNVIGLQFHLETTPESLDAIIENCRGELLPGEFVQSEEFIRSRPPEVFADINGQMERLLAWLSRDSVLLQDKPHI